LVSLGLTGDHLDGFSSCRISRVLLGEEEVEVDEECLENGEKQRRST
jgi:hypothetical protein